MKRNSKIRKSLAPSIAPQNFTVGDRVQAIWSKETVGTVKSIRESKTGNQIVNVAWDMSEGAESELLATSLLFLSHSKNGSLKINNRVTFKQHWYGELHEFEGTVQTLNEPAGTALVKYDVPEHLQDGVERCCQLRSKIATFALAKVVESENLRAQIAAILATGPIAPDRCWIERWQRTETFVEVRYKARSPIFPGKRGMASCQYIGKWGSPAHRAAVEAVDRRNRIAKLQKQLEKINANS
jgi:hypothetical protein